MVDKILYEFVKECGYEKALDMFKNISSGKKLRSKLILKIAGENEISLRLCAVIELIHLASLLHDDVIDDSTIRRGKPSINALYGSKNSIMLGDILYSKGYYEIVNLDPQIAKIISKAVLDLSIGEMMDVDLGSRFNPNLDEYLKMIELKTAVLIEAAARSAAILAKLDDEAYAVYGKNLGLAFQIVDDILDIISDENRLGKPAFNDYKEGKTTLPYIFLYNALNLDDKEILKSLWGKELDENQTRWIKDKFDEFDIVKKSKIFAKELGNKAISAVSNHSLQEIVSSMIDREF
ncbi:polyprenyl synthetase family protein [Campylobacter sp. CX2-8023-23]|uniref:polyprenyl synthetase family protein n=1 Tax=Campylobacter porcelli TaxID=1660073 RepID=UPI000A330AB4|nr:polyprenyl synthetase family protein [Campylobacter sp. P0078]MEE3704937.1 polyprenyl synthetase family protein [Campylobacter sp. CX2-8023-23]MEE3777304.1 polyprenyl synthetase family protein [Campylobacter sp. CX2-4080-23]